MRVFRESSHHNIKSKQSKRGEEVKERFFDFSKAVGNKSQILALYSQGLYYATMTTED